MQPDTSLARAAAPEFFLQHLRTRWARGLRCPSDAVFALSVSALWAVLYNLRFWHGVLTAMWRPTPGSGLFMASLFVLVLCVQALPLLLMPTRRLMKAAASVLFVLAALTSYFSNAYGAVMDEDMMRNVLQTDPAEVAGLLNMDLLLHVLLLGLVPAVLVWRVELPEASWPARLGSRGRAIILVLAACAVALFARPAAYAVFLREHKPVRYALVPAAPLSSMSGIASGALATALDGGPNRPLLNPAGEVRRIAPPGARPLVLFLVVGETARAQDFELGGYERATTPRLAALAGRRDGELDDAADASSGDLVYFDRASACGTSTAVSVPCLFSPQRRTAFDVDDANRYTNLLDSLAAAGLDVEWRDNNAGCKGVCARVRHIDYADRADATLCPHSYCYDEVMLDGLTERLRDLQRDTVIVFHQIGSHGPAYAERYPPQFEIFKPACRSNELQRCTAAEIRNAYDNTIAYTDEVLARQIELLRAAAERVDALLIYVSDHGESLGEQGLYLHGLPYAFAPEAQKRVPMLMWTSAGYARRAGLRSGCLRTQAAQPVSHDNLYHTVLGATEVRNRLYDAGLDLLAGCRNRS